MKYLFTVAGLVFCSTLIAQFNDASVGTLKLGAGYTKDFPGLRGISVYTAFSKPLNNYLEAEAGIKYINLQGTPRTSSINEYTKATTLDFTLYFLPVNTELHALRIGGGYSFSFYKINRSYPTIDKTAEETTTNWIQQPGKGRSSGFTLIGEYQYNCTEQWVVGVRAALFQAYDQVSYLGPYVALRL